MMITDDQKTWLNSVQPNEPYDLVRYVFFQPYQSARLVHFAKGVITIKPTSNYYMKILTTYITQLNEHALC